MRKLASALLVVAFTSGCASKLPKAATSAGEAMDKATASLSAMQSQALRAMRANVASGAQPKGVNADMEKFKVQIANAGLAAPGTDAAVLVRNVMCGHFRAYAAYTSASLSTSTISDTADNLKKLAKAPDGGLTANLRAINQHRKALTADTTAAGATGGEVVGKKAAECNDRMAKLINSYVSNPLPSYVDKSPVSTAFSAALAAVISLKDVATKVTAMIEENARAIAIQQYIKARGPELASAVYVLTGVETEGLASPAPASSPALPNIDRDLKNHYIAIALQSARARLDLCCAAWDFKVPRTIQEHQASALSKSHADALVDAVEKLEAVYALSLDEKDKGIAKALATTIGELNKASSDQWRLSWENLQALIEAVSILDKQVHEFEDAKEKLKDNT